MAQGAAPELPTAVRVARPARRATHRTEADASRITLRPARAAMMAATPPRTTSAMGAEGVEEPHTAVREARPARRATRRMEADAPPITPRAGPDAMTAATPPRTTSAMGAEGAPERPTAVRVGPYARRTTPRTAADVPRITPRAGRGVMTAATPPRTTSATEAEGALEPRTAVRAARPVRRAIARMAAGAWPTMPPAERAVMTRATRPTRTPAMGRVAARASHTPALAGRAARRATVRTGAGVFRATRPRARAVTITMRSPSTTSVMEPVGAPERRPCVGTASKRLASNVTVERAAREAAPTRRTERRVVSLNPGSAGRACA